jgi:aspartate aminotransferase
MAISKQMEAAVAGSSLIRKMFEEGARLAKEFGAENVFDFSIGNPVFEPPPEVHQSLIKLLEEKEAGAHRYMPNAGYPKTRQYIADQLNLETGLGFEVSDLIMCVGAGGGLNVVLKTILDPADEVVVFTPYFVEYDVYISNHGGIVRRIKSRSDFSLDLTALAEAITKKTKAVLLNSPNNPTGVVYPENDLKRLGVILKEKSDQFGHPITIISDEPYKRIHFEVRVPSQFLAYENTIVVTSHSKDLALPGERIGYIAISPQHEDRKMLTQGLTIALRTLGFVNAPALMQRVLPLIGKAMVDIKPYRRNRDILYQHLIKLGFSCVKPDGGFYLFPQSPIKNDMEFIQAAQKLNLLLVPGSAFGTAGYFRIAFCFQTELIERSLPIFTKLAKQFNLH